MNRTTSSRRKRWFFARAMHRAYREFLEKGGRKKRQAEKRELFAEALEPRVLFSAAPAPVEEPQAEENVEQEAAVQEAQVLDGEGE
ncbi:MAG: LEPR-XLL domain-containing protein, partial [Verrucomicrobiota bacterium]